MNSLSNILGSLSNSYTGHAISASMILGALISAVFYYYAYSNESLRGISLINYQILFMVFTGIGIALNKIIDMSWQLDAIDAEEHSPLYFPLNIYFGVLFGAALLVALGIPVISQIFGMIGMLISFLTLPYVITATLVAALICSYRAYIFATTQSKLRNTVDQAKREDPLSGDSVISALGEDSLSEAHARALRRDTDQLYDDAKSMVEERRAERDQLSAAAKEDIARLSKEAEISQLLRENEKLKEENKSLRGYRAGKKEKSDD